MLTFLSDNLAIVALLALTVIFLLLLLVVVLAAAQGAGREDKASARPAARQMNIDSLKQSFRRAVELIESNLAARSERYNLGWTLVLNESENGRELPLVAAGIPSALSTDATLATQALGIGWNFFDKGVAVQLQGAYLGDPDAQSAAGQKVWDEFLGLCRNYRPDRPFDSIVLAVPARLLLATDPQGQLELGARAKAIHRRLWLVQNRFALQFPVYLVVTGCEAVPGFTSFAAALPENLRAGMLGWSSPYELGAPFQPQWIDTGMNEVARDVQDACAELGALEVAGNDGSAYFMLPTEIERLRGGLKVFAEELMRPSAYHEPFILRGFWLTGDCGPASELLAASQPALEGAEAAPTEGLPAALQVEGLSNLPAIPLDQQPAFLRDLFEKKVFAEAGLVRASSVQHLRRPALNRAIRWGALAVPAAWAVALVFAGIRLPHVAEEMVSALQQLDRDARAALARGDSIDFQHNRNRALTTLALMERVDTGMLRAVPMPGSWAVFDDLQPRLQRRLERGFSENSLEPLRQGAYARVSELTGVPTDPSTGQLIAGATCSLPRGWDAAVRSASRTGIDVEDLPEFSAMLAYAGRLEEVERAVRAMQRLVAGPGPAASEDLKLAVRVFLGAELSGDSRRAAALLREQARGTVPLALPAMQQAAACAFGNAMGTLHARLFSRNELLVAEQDMARRLQQLVANPEAAEWTVLAQDWSTVLQQLRQEEALLMPGKGAWIHRRALQLGPAYENLLQRMQALQLVGPAPVDQARQSAQHELARFLAVWDGLMAGSSDPLGSAGLQWLEKEGRWALSEDRLALQAGLVGLFNQPFMRLAGRRALPEAPPGAVVSWDRPRLDQALALGEARKRFQVELLPKFPVAVRSDFENLVNAALADGVTDQVAQAMLFVPRGPHTALPSDAERGRIARARMLLTELGAEDASLQLNDVLARDAYVRLKALDDSFRQAEVYQPREVDLRSWSGDKGPMVAAFGAGDGGGLAAYVAQQQVFIDGVAREAEPLLASLDGNNDPLVARWRGIVGDVARYRLKSPASSLVALEQFVTGTMADVDLGNCAEKLQRVAARRGSDFFAERMAALQAAAASRCKSLKFNEGQLAWRRFAEEFNRDLAGRSPFRAAGMPERPAADAEELGLVLKGFDRVQRSLAAGSSGGAGVRRFAEQMERVSAFLAPLYPAEDGAAAGYDVHVEFRANQAAELEGNKIIDWVVAIGGQQLRRGEAPRPLRWEPGQPVSVSLRLARDGPVAPKPNPGLAGVVVDDRTVTWTARDPWALFSMIGSLRASEGQARSDARSQLLRFEFPILTQEQPKAPPAEGVARVFLRLALSPAGKRAPLAWPGSFPARAPEWAQQ